MTPDFAHRQSHHPTRSVARRMLAGMWRQATQTPTCPEAPRLDEKIALVTGGSRGIGLETSRGLAARGAEVVMASRGEAAGARIAEEMGVRLGRPTHFVPLDLSDLEQIPRALDRLESTLAGRTLDIVAANAGLWPTAYGVSAQGHEIAFATNVLGHHALLHGALERGLVADDARIVMLTGDIYILADDCSPNYEYRGPIGGQLAYCRSKLGNLWYVQELARRFPALRVHAVHPGVVASELAVGGGLAGWLKSWAMLPVERGAQTSLFCATQPDLPSGSYYHNVLGRVELHPSDPAADAEKARALWGILESLCKESARTRTATA